MGKDRFCWEGKVNISIILTDLFCNETEWCHDHTVIWYNIRFEKIQLPHVTKSYDNTNVDDQVHWENELKPLQDVIFLEK